MATVLISVRVAPEDADRTVEAAEVVRCEAFQLKPLIDGRKTVVFTFTFLDGEVERAEAEARGLIEAHLLTHEVSFEHVLTHTERDHVGVSTFTVHRRSDGEHTGADLAVRAFDRAKFEDRLQRLRTFGYLQGTSATFADDYSVSVEGPAPLDPDVQGPPFTGPDRP